MSGAADSRARGPVPAAVTSLPPLWAAWAPALLVGVFSLLVRLLWAYHATITPISDFHGYDVMAWQWVSEGVLDTGYRTPGTPAYYALIYLVFGHSVKWAAYVNAFATASASALLVVATARLASVSAGVIAGLFHATSPTALAYVPVIASENPAALLLAAVLVAVLAIDDARHRAGGIVRAGIAGVLLSGLVLTRPIALLMVPGFGLVVLRDLRRGRWRPAAALALVGGFALTWTPWSLFNVAHGRSPLTVSTQGPIALWWDHVPYAFRGHKKRIPPNVAGLPEAERAAVMRHDFFRWVQADFGTYLSLCRARAVRCLGLAHDPWAAGYMTPTALNDEGLAGSYWHRTRGHPKPSAEAIRAQRVNQTRGRALQTKVRLIVAPLTLLAALLAARRPASFTIILLPAFGYLAGMTATVFIERYRELLDLLLAVPLGALLSDVLCRTRDLGQWPGRRVKVLAVVLSLCAAWGLHATGWVARWQSAPPPSPRAWRPTPPPGAATTQAAVGTPGGEMDRYRSLWTSYGVALTITRVGDALQADIAAPAHAGTHYGGVRLPINAPRAFRLTLAFTNPENIGGVFIEGCRGRLDRLYRWKRDAAAAPLSTTPETYTFVPGTAAEINGFRPTVTGTSHDAQALEVFVTVRPGTRAGLTVSLGEVDEQADE